MKDKAYKSGKSFKEVLNRTLETGLAAQAAPPEAKPYRVQPVSLGGVKPGVELDRALRLADALEDEEIARKIELRK